MIKDEDDEETSYKMKKEILLSKLMCDKSIINDKTFANSFVDNVITLIYLSLSPESRKLILDKQCGIKNRNVETESNTFFHHLIGFNQENFLKNPVITNETILYLCNNILKNEDCNYNLKAVFQSQNEETEEKLPEVIIQETVVQEVPDLQYNCVYIVIN